jgi:hypothetical protein
MVTINTASVNGINEYRVYEDTELIARFTTHKHAEYFATRLNNRAYVLINEDNDLICAFDYLPTIESIKEALEEAYSMPINVYEEFKSHNYWSYRVLGDDLDEFVHIDETILK